MKKYVSLCHLVSPELKSGSVSRTTAPLSPAASHARQIFPETASEYLLSLGSFSKIQHLCTHYRIRRTPVLGRALLGLKSGIRALFSVSKPRNDHAARVIQAIIKNIQQSDASDDEKYQELNQFKQRLTMIVASKKHRRPAVVRWIKGTVASLEQAEKNIERELAILRKNLGYGMVRASNPEGNESEMTFLPTDHFSSLVPQPLLSQIKQDIASLSPTLKNQTDRLKLHSVYHCLSRETKASVAKWGQNPRTLAAYSKIDTSVPAQAVIQTAVCGGQVGKSSWIERLVKENFNPDIGATVGTEFRTVAYQSFRTVKHQIFDFSGRQDLQSLTFKQLQEKNAYFCCFNLADNSESDIAQIQKLIKEIPDSESNLFVFVGLQSVEKIERKATKIEALATEKNAVYFEVDTKNNQGVDVPFKFATAVADLLLVAIARSVAVQ